MSVLLIFLVTLIISLDLIARFFTAQRMSAMLLHDRAGKLFCWNRCVHDQHNGTPKSA